MDRIYRGNLAKSERVNVFCLFREVLNTKQVVFFLSFWKQTGPLEIVSAVLVKLCQEFLQQKTDWRHVTIYFLQFLFLLPSFQSWNDPSILIWLPVLTCRRVLLKM